MNILEAPYLSEFLTVALVHLLAVASPGPDFAIIVKQSISQGRKAALWSSLGIGLGIFIHVFYSLLGIGLVISQSITAFNIMKFLGAAYLAYLGVKGLKTKKVATNPSTTQAVEVNGHRLNSDVGSVLCIGSLP